MIDGQGYIRCDCDECKRIGHGEVLGRVINNVVQLQDRRHGVTHSITLNGYVLLATGLTTVDIKDRRQARPKAEFQALKPLGTGGLPLSQSGRLNSGVNVPIKIKEACS